MVQVKRSKSAFLLSMTVTLLLIVVVAALLLITYRIETMLNIEPFVIFTLTDHLDGTFSYTIFNMKGQFDMQWANQIVAKINEFQGLIPLKLKAFFQIVESIINTGANQLLNIF